MLCIKISTCKKKMQTINPFSNLVQGPCASIDRYWNAEPFFINPNTLFILLLNAKKCSFRISKTAEKAMR